MWNNFFSTNCYPESYNNWSSNTTFFSRSSGRLRVVNPDPGDINASAVCAIATLSGVSYAKAWNTAITHGFTTSGGMHYSDVKATLNELGVNCTHYDEAPKLDDLPDLAMITVRGESNEYHAVVFERQSDGKEYIYDSNKSNLVGPEDYTLIPSDGYLTIDNPSSPPSSYDTPPSPPSSYYAPPSPPPSYYTPSSSAHSSSRSSSNLRVVNPDPGDQKSCGVCAIAVVSGVSYAKAWNTAIDNGFKKNSGMYKSQMKATLEDLGVSSTYYHEAPGWDDLDDLAIISVRLQPTDEELHAVVFERRPDGQEYIYDSHNKYPVGPEGYALVRDNGYLKINKGAGGPYA